MMPTTASPRKERSRNQKNRTAGLASKGHHFHPQAVWRTLGLRTCTFFSKRKLLSGNWKQSESSSDLSPARLLSLRSRAGLEDCAHPGFQLLAIVWSAPIRALHVRWNPECTTTVEQG